MFRSRCIPFVFVRFRIPIYPGSRPVSGCFRSALVSGEKIRLWKWVFPSGILILDPSCPFSFYLLPSGILGETCIGLCTRESCALHLGGEGKAWQGASGSRLADSPFCRIGRNPPLLLCPPVCTSFRSCIDSCQSVYPRCISDCCRRDEEIDRAPILLGRPILTSCPGVP